MYINLCFTSLARPAFRLILGKGLLFRWWLCCLRNTLWGMQLNRAYFSFEMQNRSEVIPMHFPLALPVEREPKFSQPAAPISIMCQLTGFLIFLFLFHSGCRIFISEPKFSALQSLSVLFLSVEPRGPHWQCLSLVEFSQNRHRHQLPFLMWGKKKSFRNKAPL